MTQEQNFETPRTMGMSRGFLGRVIALGLFVSVGTFAVTHSLSKPKSLAQAEVDEQEQAENNGGADSPEESTQSPKVVDNIPSIVAANAAAIEQGERENVPNIIKASVNSPATNENQTGFSANPASSTSPTRDARNLGESNQKETASGASKLRDGDNSFSPLTQQNKPESATQKVGDSPNQRFENGFQYNPTSPNDNKTGGGFESPPSRSFDPNPSGNTAQSEGSADQSEAPAINITNPVELSIRNPATASPESSAQPLTGAKSNFESPPVRSVDNFSDTSPNTKTDTKPDPEPKADEPNANQIRPLAVQPPADSVRPESLGAQETAAPPPTLPNPATSVAASGSPGATSVGAAAFGGAIAPLGGPGTPAAQNQPQIQYPTQVSATNRPFDNLGAKPLGNLDSPTTTPATTPTAEGQPFVTQPAAQPTPQPAAQAPIGQPRLTDANQSLTESAPSRNEPPSAFPMIPADSSLEARPLAASGIAGTRATPGEAALEGLQRPSLTIQKIAPAEIQVNQTAKFKIVVRNVGQVAATEVIVSDQIPVGAELVGANPSAENRTSDGKVQWNLGRIAAGDEKSIELEIRPTRPGEIGSVAQVTFSTQASARTRVTRPELAVEHSGPAKVLIGNQVPLRFVVHNRGDGPATDVLLLERVPNQLKFNDEFRDLEYPVGTIPPGKSKEINLSLTAVEAGRFNNIVMVTGAGGLESRHQIEIEVVAPQLEGEISGPTRRFLKREASHKFTISNSGTAPASNLDIVARLPRGVQFVSANNRGQYDPGSHSVYWSLAELTPSQSATVELSTLPVETGNHEIEFRMTADLKQSVTRRQALTIEHLVDVFFDIRDTTDPIEVGGNTSYRIRIVNQGTKPASEVRLEVNMAEGVRATRVDSTAAHEIRGQVVSFAPITSINPGEEVVVEIEAVGTSPGEHRVSANLRTAEREINLTKEESTRVYADR